MNRRVYLDFHSTTPVDRRVLERMLPYFAEKFGNAASRSHAFGWEAEKAVELARKRVAELAGAWAREIVFTSGATESNNLAIKGVCGGRKSTGHLITMATEHRAVLDPVRRMEAAGWRVTVLAPRADGLLDPGRLREALCPDTALVSVMYANNEIGVIQPVREIGTLCRERGILFHCDAVQAFGKIPVDVEADGIDLMSMTAHKIYGPKGVGALYVRRGPKGAPRLAAQMDGGGHELGLRPGTLNVPGIVGFGEAAAICGREMAEEGARVKALRDRLIERLTAELDEARVNGSMERRLPGNLNMSFAGVDAEALLMSLPEIALSTGSACSSATVETSHVLRAMGLPEHMARGAVRFGLGRTTTGEEIEYAAGRVVEAVRKLRKLSPVYEG